MFWEFNGDNKSQCNQDCPYCYGGIKENKHYWNGDVEKWEKALMRLNRDLYIVFSYGESLCAKGFYECVDMIGRHPTWTLCIVSNLKCSPARLVKTRLAREGRLFMNPCWHPFGVGNMEKGWENFKQNILLLKKHNIPTHVLFLWWKPQIKLFPKYFDWLDANDFRVTVRRYVGNVGGLHLPFFRRVFGGKNYPKDYTADERGYLDATTCPKVAEYGLNLTEPKGKLCSATKDMILIKHDGSVGYCADCPDKCIGNIFDPNFKLNDNFVVCPNKICGGDYGMLHLVDERFGALPEKLEADTFVSQIEGIKQTSPVQYRDRELMKKCLENIRK